MTIKEADLLINYILEAGKRLVKKAGAIEDIGTKKQFLTEEDIRIERDIKRIVSKYSTKSTFFAEEENSEFINEESIWVVDPVSGTKLFIDGKPNYAIVASHLNKGRVDFAVVHNPSNDDLYIADSKMGAFLNGRKLTKENNSNKKVVFAVSLQCKEDSRVIDSIEADLASKFKVMPKAGSFAIHYCMVAEGEIGGVVSLTKDAFPEFAGCFIANQSGYTATNIAGSKDLEPGDREFVCAGGCYHNLINILRRYLKS